MNFQDLPLRLSDIESVLKLSEDALITNHPLMQVFMKTYVLIKRLSNRNMIIDLYLNENGAEKNDQKDDSNSDMAAVRIA